MEAFNSMLGSEKLQSLASDSRELLTVRIFSFSFHRGCPKMRRAMAADLFSMRAACRIPDARSGSKLSPAKTRR